MKHKPALLLPVFLFVVACQSRAHLPSTRHPLVATDREALAPMPSEPRELEDPYALRYATGTLPNGLGITVAPRRSMGSIAIVLATARGGIDDAERNLGADALLVETIRRRHYRHATPTPNHGMHTRVTRTQNGAFITVRSASNRLREALDEVAAIVQTPISLSNEDFQHLQTQLTQSLGTPESSSRALLNNGLRSLLHAENTPQQRTTRMLIDSINEATPATLISAHQRFFQPQHAYLSIAGDLNSIAAMRWSRERLENWPSRDSEFEPPEYDVSEDHDRLFAVLTPRIRTYIELNEQAPGLSHPDYAAFLVIEQLLGGMFGSNLNVRLREAANITYRFHGYYRTDLYSGTLQLSTTIDNAYTRTVLRLLVNELRRIRGDNDETFQDWEFAVARSRARACYVSQLETSEGLANALANLGLSGQSPSTMGTIIRRLNRLTPTTIHTVAQRWLRPDQAPIGIITSEEVYESQLHDNPIGSQQRVRPQD